MVVKIKGISPQNFLTLGFQTPCEEVFGPQKHALNTFSGGIWKTRLNSGLGIILKSAQNNWELGKISGWSFPQLLIIKISQKCCWNIPVNIPRVPHVKLPKNPTNSTSYRRIISHYKDPVMNQSVQRKYGMSAGLWTLLNWGLVVASPIAGRVVTPFR